MRLLNFEADYNLHKLFKLWVVYLSLYTRFLAQWSSSSDSPCQDAAWKDNKNITGIGIVQEYLNLKLSFKDIVVLNGKIVIYSIYLVCLSA